MQYLDLTLPAAAENLALDEALLEAAEQGDHGTETLRLWEPDAPMVVLGRSSRADREVNLEACRRRDIPVLRRTSGGAAIVAGPGCLMVTLVLGYELRPQLRAADLAHRFVIGKLVSALRPLVPEIPEAAGAAAQGISDVAIGNRKFSGNALRCKRNHFLYHGTLLYDFPLDLIEICLKMPPREPDYRDGRPHKAFVTNLPLDATTLRHALAQAWQATQPSAHWPREATARLVAEKYSQKAWNESR